MTAPNSYILAPLTQSVDVRTPFTPRNTPFSWVNNVVRCDRVVYRQGPSVGYAELVVQFSNATLAEQLEQVKLGQDVGIQVKAENGDVHLLFAGQLMRHSIQVQADPPASATQEVRVLAIPFPAIESGEYARLIRGRAMQIVAGEKTHQTVVESLSLPAIFNWQGRPNMDSRDPASIALGGGATFEARWFTHDDHMPESGQSSWWTVEAAIKHVVGFYCYGYPVEETLYIGPTSRTLSWDGLLHGCEDTDSGKQIPECNITGKGVLDALQEVCHASGLAFCVQPRDASGYGAADDRNYVLRIYKQGVGRAVYRPSMPPGDQARTYSSPEQFWGECQTNKLVAQNDLAEIVNHVTAVAAVYIEARIRLRPLWNPDDMLAEAASMDGQGNDSERMGVAGSYHSRHVHGGSEFARYGHVGRAWGVDCVGRWSWGFPGGGYGEAPYAHPGGQDGFDWSTLPGPGEAKYWSHRVRRLLPLRSKAAVERSIQYLLYVSEDAGATWHPCPVQFASLSDECGIRLPIGNLMMVNLESLREGIEADPQDSWWELIRSRKLLFEVVAAIEADHVASEWAAHRRECPYLGQRAAWIPTRHEEIWLGPGTPGNPATYGFIIDTGTVASGVLQSTAAALRNAKDRGRFSASLSSPLFRGLDGHVGKRVPKLDGRNLVLGSADAATGPLVVSQSYELGPPESGQSVRLNLDDDRSVGPL